MGNFYSQSGAFIVELEEGEWYGKDTAAVIRDYENKARDRKLTMLSIFVTPDPLFPACGHDKRHRVHSVELVGTRQKPYMLEIAFKASIDGNVLSRLSEGERNKLVRTVRDNLNEQAILMSMKGRYEIVCSAGKVIESGRV